MILGKNPENILKEFFKISPAQAFLLVGAGPELENLFLSFVKCEEKSFCRKCLACRTDNLWDLQIFEGESLKIEEAREIRRAAFVKGFSGTKIFFLKNGRLPAESQGVLLKTIEEPPPETYFIISLASEGSLLAPLRSRLTVFSVGREPENERASKDFSLRLEDIAALSKEASEVERILERTEEWIEAKLQNARPGELGRLKIFLEDFFEIKRRFFERTYSSRMLLEHLAVSKYYLES